ncbi:MAG: hypothetical protein MK185_04790 [Saccharospirillaceae bacterium]|nr:hypothetical protein [Saccharospirillaceae bacterium]
MNNHHLTGAISANLIAAASYSQADNKDFRPALHGMLIDPHPNGGVTVVSTNGHTLFIAYDENSTISEKAIVQFSPHFIAECKRQARPIATNRYVELDGRLAYVTHRQMDETFEPGQFETLTTENLPAIEPLKVIDEIFPNYQRVIPQETLPTAAPTSLNAKYLSNLPKIADALGIPKKSQYITVFGTGDKPEESHKYSCIYRFDYRDINALLVIMPARNDFKGNGIPEWISRPTETRQEKAA